mmetsp:Transcript_108275/g.345800  ORF Transcript_108275/g.345800 Transcript_108275/m.345800 type:complete len:234 (+) Transcript_108275:312-1013(+)
MARLRTHDGSVHPWHGTGPRHVRCSLHLPEIQKLCLDRLVGGVGHLRVEPTVGQPAELLPPRASLCPQVSRCQLLLHLPLDLPQRSPALALEVSGVLSHAYDPRLRLRIHPPDSGIHHSVQASELGLPRVCPELEVGLQVLDLQLEGCDAILFRLLPHQDLRCHRLCSSALALRLPDPLVASEGGFTQVLLVLRQIHLILLLETSLQLHHVCSGCVHLALHLVDARLGDLLGH